MTECMDASIDVQIKFPSCGGPRPVKIRWNGREINLDERVRRVDKTPNSQTREFWCAGVGNHAANLYHLRWDVLRMEWTLLEVRDL